MLDYIKDAWKISGQLSKVKYFSIASIIWTGVLLCFLYELVISFLQGAISPNIVDTLVQLVLALIIVFLTIVLWVLNVRFYPYAFKKLKLSTKQILENSLAEYRDVRDAGPRTYVERPDNTTYADKIIKAPLFKGGEWTVVDNSPVTRQESKASHYANAIGNGMGVGVAGIFGKFMFWFIRIVIWPVAFISGLANMGPIVHEYRRTQTTDSDNALN